MVNKPTLLIADDHPRVLDSVRLLLTADFSIVGAVRDGTALIAAAQELKPDVIVTDLIMEPTSGLAAAAAILAGSQPAPLIILLTGVEDPEIVQAALDMGIRGYVAKGRICEDLVSTVQSVLGGSRFVSAMATERAHPAA